jgi:hypothetical protein
MTLSFPFRGLEYNGRLAQLLTYPSFAYGPETQNVSCGQVLGQLRLSKLGVATDQDERRPVIRLAVTIFRIVQHVELRLL